MSTHVYRLPIGPRRLETFHSRTPFSVTRARLIKITSGRMKLTGLVLSQKSVDLFGKQFRFIDMLEAFHSPSQ